MKKGGIRIPQASGKLFQGAQPTEIVKWSCDSHLEVAVGYRQQRRTNTSKDETRKNCLKRASKY